MNLHEGRTHITFDKGTCNKASLTHWVTELNVRHLVKNVFRTGLFC